MQDEAFIVAASVEITAMTALSILFDLIDRPESLAEIRDEISQVYAEYGSWTRQALGASRIMDSFMKESQRLHTSQYSMQRSFRNMARYVCWLWSQTPCSAGRSRIGPSKIGFTFRPARRSSSLAGFLDATRTSILTAPNSTPSAGSAWGKKVTPPNFISPRSRETCCSGAAALMSAPVASLSKRSWKVSSFTLSQSTTLSIPRASRVAPPMSPFNPALSQIQRHHCSSRRGKVFNHLSRSAGSDYNRTIPMMCWLLSWWIQTATTISPHSVLVLYLQ